MLDDGDEIYVQFSQSCHTVKQDRFVHIGGTKKVYIINLSKIECIVEETNKDGEDGMRIYFSGGNSVWIDRNKSKQILDSLRTWDPWYGSYLKEAEDAFC